MAGDKDAWVLVRRKRVNGVEREIGNEEIKERGKFWGLFEWCLNDTVSVGGPWV